MSGLYHRWMAGWRVGLTWEVQGHLLDEENWQEKKAWGKGKVRSYWSPEELATTRTQRHHVSWQRRSAKEVVREVAWNMWDGLCNAVWAWRIATTSESWRYFSLSNKADSPFRRLLNPGRTASQKKNQKIGFVSRMLQFTDHLLFLND